MVHLSVAAAAATDAVAPLGAEAVVVLLPPSAGAALGGLVLTGAPISEDEEPCRPLVTLFTPPPLPDDRRLVADPTLIIEEKVK